MKEKEKSNRGYQSPIFLANRMDSIYEQTIGGADEYRPKTSRVSHPRRHRKGSSDSISVKMQEYSIQSLVSFGGKELKSRAIHNENLR